MKYIFSFLLIFYSVATLGQYENLKLENGQVFFEKVYIIDSTKAEIISQILATAIPKVNDLSDFAKTNELITAKLKNAKVDYRKYGGKWGNTATVLNHPFTADVSIIWKDNKYKVTVTNIVFNTDGFGLMKCSDIFTSKRGKEWDISKGAVKAGTYIDKYLSDLFVVSKTQNTDW